MYLLIPFLLITTSFLSYFLLCPSAVCSVSLVNFTTVFPQALSTSILFLESFVWDALGVPLIVVLGLYFTVFKAKGAQFRALLNVPSILKDAFNAEASSETEHGISPWRILMTCVGGAVGIGNIAGICLAVQMGGPGALFWVWVVAILGVVLKYSEVYLGMKTRVLGPKGYEGGPAQYLPKAFGSNTLATLASILLCIYGVEIYQFHVMVDSVSLSWGFDPIISAVVLLVLVLAAALGGFQRVSLLASRTVPVFIVTYLIMSLCVLFYYIDEIPGVLALVVRSALTGHAPLAGFAGASFLSCVQHGIARGCYASDIGIGYNAMLHAESHDTNPVRQASLTYAGVLIDLLGVCTLSLLMVLVSGVWLEPVDSSLLVQHALSKVFPGMHLFMPLMILMLGYSTVIAFFAVGLKSAQSLFPSNQKKAKIAFFILGGAALFFFTFLKVEVAMSFMSLCGGALLILHLIAFWKLRHMIKFK